MSDLYRRRLEARVKAVNRAHAEANRLCALFRAHFTDLVGKKILTVDGNFMARVKQAMPELPHTDGLMVYRYRSEYSLTFVVKTNEMIEGEHSCLYYEASFDVGNLDGQNLKEIDQRPCEYRTDFTAEEIADLRADYQQKQKIADAAKSALYPFGEHDR